MPTTRIVCFRLTVEEYRQMQAAAEQMGSPVARLFRDAIDRSRATSPTAASPQR